MCLVTRVVSFQDPFKVPELVMDLRLLTSPGPVDDIELPELRRDGEDGQANLLDDLELVRKADVSVRGNDGTSSIITQTRITGCETIPRLLDNVHAQRWSMV